MNDPAAIALMVAVTATVASGSSSYGHAVFQFFEELAIGSAAGIAGAAILVFVVARHAITETSTRSLSFSGLSFLVGLPRPSWQRLSRGLHRRTSVSDTWASRTGLAREVPEALSATAEVVLFATLAQPLRPWSAFGDLASGLALTLITVFAVRPLVTLAVCLVGSGLSPRDRRLVSWGGLKGAVPLLLAAYPALEHFTKADDVAAMVLVATAASLLVQGGTLPYFAGRAAAAEDDGT